MASHDSKPYDLVLLGATGFTGSRTAIHIALHGPAQLRWAIAGRDKASLGRVLDKIRASQPNLNSKSGKGPAEPAIEIVSDFKTEQGRSRLDDLVKKSALVLSTVGPFHRYGQPVVEACAENGVHYVDCTGEVPWVADMISRYQATAVRTGAYMIPQCGIDSVPSDLLVWLLADDARTRFGHGLQQAVNVCTEMSMKPSNGTAITMFSLLESYSISQIFASVSPFALSPRRPKEASTLPPKTASTLLTGLWSVDGHSNLIETPLTMADKSQIGRSWGLHQDGQMYGPQFKHGVFLKMPNMVVGVLTYYFLLTVQAVMAVPPLARLLQMINFNTGADRSNEKLSYRASGLVDSDSGRPDQVHSWLDWVGDGYYLTGIFVAEASFILLEKVGRLKREAEAADGDNSENAGVTSTGKKRLAVTDACRPGIITPSTLGHAFVERLNNAGLKIGSSRNGVLEEKKKW